MTFKYTCLKKCCDIFLTEPNTNFINKKKRGQCRKAGVFIYDPDKEKVLLVQSRGQLWGPPKGTLEVEQGEQSCECAIREVKEETGLDIDSVNFSKAIKIKNKALYYYMEMKSCDIGLQTENKENDANGITWIKLSCLKDCCESGHIVTNEHCKILLKKFLGFIVPRSEFIKVKRRK